MNLFIYPFLRLQRNPLSYECNVTVPVGETLPSTLEREFSLYMEIK